SFAARLVVIVRFLHGRVDYFDLGLVVNVYAAYNNDSLFWIDSAQYLDLVSFPNTEADRSPVRHRIRTDHQHRLTALLVWQDRSGRHDSRRFDALGDDDGMDTGVRLQNLAGISNFHPDLHGGATGIGCWIDHRDASLQLGLGVRKGDFRGLSDLHH